MWANRITVDYVKHEDARKRLEAKLAEKGVTDECIDELNISTDSGYVVYRVVLSDNTKWTIFDNGSEMC